MLEAALADGLVRDASRHGLAAWVRHELLRRGLELPEAAAEALDRAALAEAGNAARARVMLIAVLRAFEERGLVPLLLKGLGLSARYYPHVLLRYTTDLDLLFPEPELPRAEEALGSLGLQRGQEYGQGFERAHHHHHTFASPAGIVELHFRTLAGFGTTLGAEALWARSVAATFDDLPVRYLCPEDELVYLSAHAAQHLFARLAWLLDLRLLLERHPGLDWEQVRSVAAAAGLSTPVGLALLLAREHLGAGVSEAALRHFRLPGWQVALLGRVFTPERLLSSTLEQSPAKAALLRPLLATGPWNIARATLTGALRLTHRLGREG